MEVVEKKINAMLLLFFFILMVFVLFNERVMHRIAKKQNMMETPAIVP